MAANKTRVQVRGTTGKSVRLPTATSDGATVGENLHLADGSTPTLAQLAAALATALAQNTPGNISSPGGLAVLLWPNIQLIPPNVLYPARPIPEEDASSDSLIIPGPAGAKGSNGSNGAPGVTIPMYPDDAEDQIVIPGPMGPQGAAGSSSVVLPAAQGGGNIVVPSAVGWTLTTLGATVTATVGANGQLILNTGAASGFPANYSKAYAGGNFDIQLYITNPTLAGWGFFVRDPATGHATTIGASSGSLTAPDLLSFTSPIGATIGPFTFSATVGAYTIVAPPGLSFNMPMGWYRFTRVGNVYSIFVSLDGANWFALGAGLTSTFAAAPTQIGIYLSNSTLASIFTFWSLSGI